MAASFLANWATVNFSGRFSSMLLAILWSIFNAHVLLLFWRYRQYTEDLYSFYFRVIPSLPPVVTITIWKHYEPVDFLASSHLKARVGQTPWMSCMKERQVIDRVECNLNLRMYVHATCEGLSGIRISKEEKHIGCLMQWYQIYPKAEGHVSTHTKQCSSLR
jgi:hypothetical protein